MKPRTMSRIIARFTWDRLKVSFWFIPLVMSLGAILLARLMNWADMRLPDAIIKDSILVLSGSPSQLRASLITMATNTMATAGIVFSLLTLPLSTVAAQYGSRLLRVFLADRTSQYVLGMFAGTFVYCITAAASLPRTEVEVTGSQVMVSVAVLLLLATTGSLILLIQHISTMLQAPHIAAAAGAELDEVIHAGSLGEALSDSEQPPTNSKPDSFLETEGYPINVQHTGYIRYIDMEYLLEIAREKNLVIRLLYRPGQYIWSGKTAARVWQAGQPGERLDRQVRRAFLIGNQRTPAQDIEYGVDQLVEIAARAQSSGTRDPFTAMTCLDHIGYSLAQFTRQGEISPNICDPEGRLRLIIKPVTFAELLNTAFDMLRHNSRDNARVLLHMLEVIDAIRQETKSPEARQELLRHVVLIQAESHKGALIEPDIQLIQQRSEELQVKLVETSISEPQNPFGTNELSYAQ